ncbi:DUF7221 family queuine tRNA-ribosyltransferase-like protein [Saccharopolyspora spinosa]|uniref:deazapurine DNA modification protein DpdA family protein n=1 Tax=Saccharopolyspora spinosa TaxID=60894 RepID=UPI003B4326E7
MRFFLGTHQPSWLARDLGVPLLVSHRRLAGRRTLPRATGPWALDSGGFTELSLHGRWLIDERTYTAAVRRYATEIGHLAWAAPMDHMTEAHILARTGSTVRTHQRRTVTNYLRLREIAPDLPFIAVLQGQSISDYHWCADLYEKEGVDLATLPLLGVGSVCRRQHTAEVEQIMRSLAVRGYRLHAFGAKVLGLGRYADAISSSDSAAWSFRGRYVPGCTPGHRSESNCVHFALSWHAQLMETLRTHHARQHRQDNRQPRISAHAPESTDRRPPASRTRTHSTAQHALGDTSHATSPRSRPRSQPHNRCAAARKASSPCQRTPIETRPATTPHTGSSRECANLSSHSHTVGNIAHYHTPLARTTATASPHLHQAMLPQTLPTMHRCRCIPRPRPPSSCR